MKRFHIHVRVTDLQASIGFYSKLFGAGPAAAVSCCGPMHSGAKSSCC
jgi:predicted enzyme related to lactoylglutathione lyase